MEKQKVESRSVKQIKSEVLTIVVQIGNYNPLDQKSAYIHYDSSLAITISFTLQLVAQKEVKHINNIAQLFLHTTL